MVTIDDVATIVGNQLTATSAFAAAVPGGISFGRDPDTPSAYPYAVFHVSPRETELATENTYVQAFQVDVASYCPVGMEGANPLAVQEALFAALADQAANVALQGTSLRNASERIMHSRPLPAKGQFAPQLRQGRDVFVAGLQVEILVQGDRSVS